MTNKTILYATDYSLGSEEVLKVASTLARQEDAKLLIVHVTELELLPVGEHLDKDPEPTPADFERLTAIVPPHADVRYEHCLQYGEPGSVEITDPAKEILKLAERENVDTIVMGTHGRTGFSHLLMGSVAETVFGESSRPVIAVKLPSKSDRSLKDADGNPDTQSVEVLNQLFLMHRYSLATYLQGSHEWTHPGDEPAVNALHKIANYHESCANRIAKVLDDTVGQVPNGQFPMEYTAHNDIALDYLVPKLIEQEQSIVQQTEELLTKLGSESKLKGLIEPIIETQMSYIEVLTVVQRTLTGTE